MTRTALFEAIRPYAPGQRFTPAMVTMIDDLADRFGLARLEGVGKMHITEEGLSLIMAVEGLKLVAYRDTGGVLTVGYGHTGPDVKPGLTITKDRARELLREDVAEAEAIVSRLFNDPTQGQFDALVSFVYNLGEEQVRTSTLRRLHNKGDYAGAAAQFARWNKDNGRVLPGLVKRRAAEAERYVS